jgi:hypothetical protein
MLTITLLADDVEPALLLCVEQTGSCSTSVGLHVNKTDAAAMLTPSMFIMTLPECLTACYNNPNCIGIEIRPNGSLPKSPIAAASFQSGLCYQSLRSNGNLQLQNSSIGVTHFDVYQNPCGSKLSGTLTESNRPSANAC